MKQRIQVASAVALIVAAGVLLSGRLQAETPAAESKTAPTKVIESYGNTQVIEVEPVRGMFSHSAHVITAGLSCDSCHPDLFARKRGTAKANGDYNMASLEAGKYCGACHDGQTAFNTTGPETCKLCHGSDMKQPETVVFSQPVKGVIFEHKEHVEMGLDCASCHDQAFEMRKGAAEERPEKFTMEAIYAGKYCGVCHNGSDAFAANTRCTTCHIGVQGVERMFADKTDTAKGKGKEKH